MKLWPTTTENKAPFGSCKSISEKYSIFRKCYFPKRKMFSCIWLHFKKCFEKYFLVFCCVLENTIENTFSTYCSHFLTFSQLPNKYIISFLNTETQKKQNPEKKFIKSGQIERRRKREVCGAAIGAVRSLPRSVRCEVRCCDRSGAIGSVCGCWTGARSEECTTVVVELELGLRTGLSLLPLSLFLSLCLCAWVWKWFEVKIFTSNTRSTENFHFKPFPGQSH